MLNKNEIYDILKDDGARLPRAVNFMSRDELLEMYVERFGVNPDIANQEKVPEQNNTPATFEENVQKKEIPLLEFAEDGWCTPLNKPYCKGLYRPESVKEYESLKKYAAKEIFA